MMNKYDKTEVMKLLDEKTLKALLRLYGIDYKFLAVRLGCTRPNIHYHLKHDTFKQYQRENILELLFKQGLEVAELVIINQLVTKQKKVKADEVN
ncbi:hypothetical protein JYA63_03425 [Fictibacillus nanhaiensis]|uniref:Transcriptional regulator n=1 Tax=Fictibacillus nanhaiensis TaxID=742169 RepID=A0ABS2ZPN1_9BACL|nr:hypothetical protein [Fictibacillus nanhaiensis]